MVVRNFFRTIQTENREFFDVIESFKKFIQNSMMVMDQTSVEIIEKIGLSNGQKGNELRL